MTFTAHDRRRMRHAARTALASLIALYNRGRRDIARAGGPYTRLTSILYLLDSYEHQGCKLIAVEEAYKELARRTEAAEQITGDAE